MTASAIMDRVRSSPVGAGLVARNHFLLCEQRRFRLDQLAELDRRGALASPDPAVREVAALLAQGARTALIDICEALRQIESGRYGWCRTCGTRLPAERLHVLPHVTRCGSCQQLGAGNPAE